MNDKFNEQKDILISIKKEISLLHQQVDYLIRNEKPLELLDLDVMMNRTHTLYDLMCGVDLGDVPSAPEVGDEEELPVEPEMLKAMFGVEEPKDLPVENEETSFEEEELEDGLEPAEEPVEEQEENEDAYFEEEVEDGLEPMEKPVEEPVEEPAEEPVEKPDRDDFGFILNFEPLDTLTTPEETPVETPVETPEETLEETPEETLEEPPVETPVETLEETLVEEPFKEPTESIEEAPAEWMEKEVPSVFTSGDEIEMTIPHLTSFDSDFEIETLGDKLQQGQNPTVADKLQHGAVSSLQRSIGINDKFLLVNELFNGSMEKYNRSIENLDDLKTLNGALIYLNELRVELQWNSSNEAYKKLLELVHRKFEA